MVFHKTDIEGLFVVELKKAEDHRGSFVKTIHKTSFEALGLKWCFCESFYSSSKKNVIRGMHFQTPPQDHEKLVVCMAGKILDVVVDLRQGSNYGKVASFFLESERPQALYIPKGMAHGFLSLDENTMVNYFVTTEHSPLHDQGIHPLSINFEWPTDNPIISERDLKHTKFRDFKTPF